MVSDHAGWVCPRAAEELGDVAAGDVGELLAALVGGHPAVGADRTQQGAGQRPRADAGLDHVGAGEDVGHGHDLGGVLGVDHRRATRHGDHELREQGPEDEVLPARGGGHGEPLLATDELVVLEVTPVGEEALARLEADVVPPALLVDQADPLPLAQRSPVDAGPRLGRDVGGIGAGVGRGRGEGLGHAANPTRRRRGAVSRWWPGTRGRRRRSTGRRRCCRPPRAGRTPRPACG